MAANPPSTPVTDTPTMLGTTVLLTAYLEDALKSISRIQSQKVPYAAKRESVVLVLDRLYGQLEPERLSLLRD